jgi:hypothetical protein
MESTERVMMRNAVATVVHVYYLGLRESSVMCLTTRAQSITHTAKTKVLVKKFSTRCWRRMHGKELLTYHRVLTALQNDYALLSDLLCSVSCMY